jgi:thioredoxin-like negative regulator of GroEL
VPPTPGFIAILCVVMAGFYAIDIYLARLQTREVDAEARALYARGQSLLEQGKPREAIDPLRKAHSQDRLNAHFALKLAQAQIGSGAAPDAQTILDEILARDSNDARANFLMARIAVADKRAVDADAYFHRAIYGKWPKDDELTGPERARLELAEYLAGRGEKRALLSEVLLLEHDPGMIGRSGYRNC